MGKDNLEGAQIDMTVDTIGDLVEPIIKWLFEKDETRKVCLYYAFLIPF